MQSKSYFRTWWMRFYAPHPTFGWFLRGMILGLVAAVTAFGGALWHFHGRLLQRVGTADVAWDPAVRDLVEAATSDLLRATAISAAGGAVFLIVLSMFLLHRIVGPLPRLERHMREVRQGGAAPSLSVRKQDRLRGTIEAYNDLVREFGGAAAAPATERAPSDRMARH